jgi:phosphoglycerate dehydrogenase-like enzyme
MPSLADGLTDNFGRPLQGLLALDVLIPDLLFCLRDPEEICRELRLAHEIEDRPIGGTPRRYRICGPHDLPGITCYHGRDQLAARLAPCDYVVCVLVETHETRDIIDTGTLALMKRGTCFINVGRGRLVVESDLLAALNSGQVSGAVLDVFRTEPVSPETPRWSHPKVVVTPHEAGGTPQCLLAHVAENYRRLLDGQPLINIADPARGY